MKKNLLPARLCRRGRSIYYAKLFGCIVVLSYILPAGVNASDKSKIYHITKFDRHNDPITVKGKVTDKSNGDPLIGVAIKVKGTSTGVASNITGDFSINADDNAILVVSYIGYETAEIPVNKHAIINISLQPSTKSLNEVVVIGYGTVKRSDATGALSSISTKELKDQPVARLDQAIQGKAAGVVIQNNTGGPNGQVTIRIRGANSMIGNNDPLVVIDGILSYTTDLTSLNPNDVASIEVLKDASATAIYGSRGANGVVLVTTKIGSVGKTVVNYNAYAGVASVRKKLDLLNAAQYAQTVNANRIEIGVAAPFSAADIANFTTNGGTDWQDAIFKKGVQQSHQVSVSGGSENIKYYFSGNFVNNDGVIKNTSFGQYAIRSNIESRINDNFKIGMIMNLSRSADHPTQLNNLNSPVLAASLFSPTLPVYNAGGTYSQPAANFGPHTTYNPVGLTQEPIADNITEKTEIDPFVEVNIIKGLTARFSGGARLTNYNNSYYFNTKPQGNVGNSTGGINNSKNVLLQNTDQINYQRTFSGGHDLNVVAVFEEQYEQNNSAFAGASGFLTDGLSYNNLSIGGNPNVSSYKNTRSIVSYVGRVNYGYKEKYLLSVSGRYDGSSVFGGNNPYAFFPSVAIGWRVNKEGFMKNIESVSNLKVRASYGVTGNQALPPYSALSQLGTGGFNYSIGGTGVSTGVGLGTIADLDLKWESTAQIDAGFDLGLFNDRVQFTADYYHKKTTDLLLAEQLPLTSGYATKLVNVGSLENKGFEFSLQGSPLVGALKWNMGFNIAFNRNKILSLVGSQPELIPTNQPLLPNFGNTSYLIVGQPLGTFKGYTQNGTWGTSADDLAGEAKYKTNPGDPKYVDVNNDGVINSKDITIIGNSQPKFTYGFNNSFSFKGVDLSVFMQGVNGNGIYNLSRVRSERASSDADATAVAILNRWTPTNQNTSVPSFKGSNGYEQLQSNRWLEDGSYLRVKTISLGYTFPASLINKAKISGLRLYLTGTNLFTATKYTGYDPEASNSNVDSTSGFDYATYPSIKSVTVGINVTLK